MAKPMAKPQQEELDIFSLLEEIEKRKAPAIDALKEEIDERLTKLKRLGEDMVLVERNELANYKAAYDRVTSLPEVRPRAPKSSTPKAGAPPKPEGTRPDGGEWKYCPEHGWGDHDGRRHLGDIKKQKAQQAG